MKLLLTAALAMIGLLGVATRAHCPQPPRAVVCIVGDLESGPHSPARAIYASRGVTVLDNQSAAQCEQLTR